MHITKYTDYSLRVLMLLALQDDDRLLGIAEISKTFRISRHHLTKVVNNLARLGLVASMRGPGGGIRLVPSTLAMTVGSAIRQLEAVDRVVDCDEQPCLFRGSCELDLAFQRATHAFLAELDQCSLANLVARKGDLQRIISPHPCRAEAATSGAAPRRAVPYSQAAYAASRIGV